MTVATGASPVAHIPASAEEFAKAMDYGSLSKEELLLRTQIPWVRELHEALVELLSPRRSVISLGSGQGEHEIALLLDGYDVTASDIVKVCWTTLGPPFRL